MPPTHVKAYVKRGKNDAADAAAICEGRNAAIDAFCADQECERQCALMLHRRPAQATQPPQRRLEGPGIEIVCEAASEVFVEHWRKRSCIDVSGL
jgi:hypothetical protein